MQIYYPALILSAIFFASILVNIHDKLYGNALIGTLLAVPSILFFVLLSQKNLDLIAYVLLLVPIVLIYVGYSLGIPNNKAVLSKDVSGNVINKVSDKTSSITTPKTTTSLSSTVTSSVTPSTSPPSTPTPSTPTPSVTPALVSSTSTSFPTGSSSTVSSIPSTPSSFPLGTDKSS